MNYLELYEGYNSSKEYKSDSRRTLDLGEIRAMQEYKDILNLGFKEDTSFQQELNNTIKFIRSRHKQKDPGFGDVFYTIHPSGIIRRYNPPSGDTNPPGSGNDLFKFPKFKTERDYRKGLMFLWQYLRRKENLGDFR